MRKALNELIKQTLEDIEGIVASMEIAEDEISKAQKRHGEVRRGPIWSSFRLLQPTSDMLRSNEALYRAHCAELLDRVARDEDTRPGTAAELLPAMKEVSLATPMTGAATGLYFRLFKRCLPELASKIFGEVAFEPEDYERIYRKQMDEHEEYLRRRLQQAQRRRRNNAPVGHAQSSDSAR